MTTTNQRHRPNRRRRRQSSCPGSASSSSVTHSRQWWCDDSFPRSTRHSTISPAGFAHGRQLLLLRWWWWLFGWSLWWCGSSCGASSTCGAHYHQFPSPPLPPQLPSYGGTTVHLVVQLGVRPDVSWDAVVQPTEVRYWRIRHVDSGAIVQGGHLLPYDPSQLVTGRKTYVFHAAPPGRYELEVAVQGPVRYPRDDLCDYQIHIGSPQPHDDYIRERAQEDWLLARDEQRRTRSDPTIIASTPFTIDPEDCPGHPQFRHKHVQQEQFPSDHETSSTCGGEATPIPLRIKPSSKYATTAISHNQSAAPLLSMSPDLIPSDSEQQQHLWSSLIWSSFRATRAA